MLFSIVHFVDHDAYQLIYRQYNDLLKSLASIDEQKYVEYHQLEQHNLLHMIQDNVDHLYWRSL